MIANLLLGLLSEISDFSQKYDVYVHGGEYCDGAFLQGLMKKYVGSERTCVFSYANSPALPLCRLSQHIIVADDISPLDTGLLDKNVLFYTKLSDADLHLPKGKNNQETSEKIKKIFILTYGVKKDLLEKDIMFQLGV